MPTATPTKPPSNARVPLTPAVRTIKELRAWVAPWRQAGERVALVPTMGALHEGHLELVRLGQRRKCRTVVSIFVNPTQFAPTEDFDKYPRQEESDRAKLAAIGCDLVFAPDRREMYPEGFATRIVPAGAAEGLESDYRPHFFGGVATVVGKLLLQSLPDIAVFGEKDYQQLIVVRQMVRDLDIPVEIVGAPTVREPDGLAMSSRNAYLSAEDRQKAVLVSQVMRQVAEAVAARPISAATAEGKDALAAAGFRVDYVEVRHAETLRPFEGRPDGPARVLIAAWLGRTRLIDNMGVEGAAWAPS